MSDDHDDDHPEPLSFINSPWRSSLGVLAALIAYWLSLFTYIENDMEALYQASRSGRPIKWYTFDKFYYSTPKTFLMPETKEELISAVKDAVDSNLSIKVVGAGHSWSPLGLTEGVMISLDRLNRVIEIDAVKQTVTVEAGIRIRDLSRRLAEHDPPLALANTGVLNRQSLAGALATGTHGTGVRQPIMSAHVSAVELLTSDGQLLFVSDEDQDDEARDVLEAARVHLGALGIVTVLRLRVVPAFSMVMRSEVTPMQPFMRELRARAEASDHLLAWWIPYTTSMQVLESNRTAYGQRPAELGDASSLKHVLESWWAWVHHELSLGKLEMRLLSAAAYLTSHLPLRFVPLLNRILIAPLFHGLAGRGGSVFVKEGYAGLILDDHPDNYQETEWFVHIDDFEAAWSEFASFLEEGRHRLGANFVVQLRFTAADEIVLSPVSGGSSKGGYYVAVATLIKNIDSQAYFRGASDIWLRHGGRPHWGKSHFLEQKELAALYGPQLERFDACRRRLDPQGVFLNGYLRTLLLPTATQ